MLNNCRTKNELSDCMDFVGEVSNKSCKLITFDYWKGALVEGAERQTATPYFIPITYRAL